MLVLSRKKQESIKIGEDIEITVIAIEGDQVKIGVKAPKTVDINRKEIVMAIEKENSLAAKVDMNILKKWNKSDEL